MHTPTVYSRHLPVAPQAHPADHGPCVYLTMFARRSRLVQTDIVLMVHQAQIWRPHRTRNRVRIYHRLRLLQRLQFFARRYVRRMISDRLRFRFPLQQPFNHAEWAQFLRFALDDSLIVPALDRT